VHRDYLHCRGSYRHRVEVGDWIIKRVFLKRWVGDERDAVHEEDGVTVSGSLGSATRTNAAAGSGDVLDIELFAQAIGQFLRNEATTSVCPPAANGTIVRTTRDG
jgi:hypothetical protein